MSVSEFFKSVGDYVKERSKNPFTETNRTPFAGAFLIALVLYNWQLFYSLIAFDPFENRLTKIKIISTFLDADPWYARILFPTLIALGSITFFYVFSNLSLAITTTFNKWVKPFILFLIDRNKLVPREDLDRVVRNSEHYQRKHSELTKLLSETQQESDKNKQYAKETNDKFNTDFEVLKGEKEALNATVRSELTAKSVIQNENKELLKIIAEYAVDETVLIKEIKIVKLKESTPVFPDFIESLTGSFATWVFLPEVESFFKSPMNHKYILGVATNNGRHKSRSNGSIFYENALGLCLAPNTFSANKELPTAIYWKLWFTNSSGEEFQMQSVQLDKRFEGWHHIAIRWWHNQNRLELLIDGVVVTKATSSYMNSWPKLVSDTEITIGNWPNRNLIHNLNMQLFRTISSSEYLPNHWFNKEMNKKPEAYDD
ncbi:MAG TPA: hypothetical protein VNZ86_16515 [Bacteroidia bacterium]|jgi:hypothetical protein|nr:hypothetical protein [Bacteroidia bacterium]